MLEQQLCRVVAILLAAGVLAGCSASGNSGATFTASKSRYCSLCSRDALPKEVIELPQRGIVAQHVGLSASPIVVIDFDKATLVEVPWHAQQYGQPNHEQRSSIDRARLRDMISAANDLWNPPATRPALTRPPPYTIDAGTWDLWLLDGDHVYYGSFIDGRNPRDVPDAAGIFVKALYAQNGSLPDNAVVLPDYASIKTRYCAACTHLGLAGNLPSRAIVLKDSAGRGAGAILTDTTITVDLDQGTIHKVQTESRTVPDPVPQHIVSDVHFALTPSTATQLIDTADRLWGPPQQGDHAKEPMAAPHSAFDSEFVTIWLLDGPATYRDDLVRPLPAPVAALRNLLLATAPPQ